MLTSTPATNRFEIYNPVIRDGVIAVTPDQMNVFSLSTVLGQQVAGSNDSLRKVSQYFFLGPSIFLQVEYLGLADLGKTLNADPGQIYQQVFLKRRVERSLIILVILAKDGDNYLDICLNLSNQPEAREEDLLLNLSCQVVNNNF